MKAGIEESDVANYVCRIDIEFLVPMACVGRGTCLILWDWIILFILYVQYRLATWAQMNDILAKIGD